ncbi:MAG: class I SAM-dependent methyltransferase [Candidatus Binataceae bacterium]
MADTQVPDPTNFREQFRKPTGFMGKVAALLMSITNAPANRLAIDALKLNPADRVLEIGFGHGRTLEKIAAIAKDGFAAGVDPSETMVGQVARRNAAAIRAGKMELKLAAASEIPYADAHFDKVVTVNTIYFWADHENDAKEIRRVLKDGGLLVVGFRVIELEGPDRWTPGQGIPYFFASDAKRIFEGAGFRDITTQVKKTPMMWVAIMSARK